MENRFLNLFIHQKVEKQTSTFYLFGKIECMNLISPRIIFYFTNFSEVYLKTRDMRLLNMSISPLDKFGHQIIQFNIHSEDLEYFNEYLDLIESWPKLYPEDMEIRRVELRNLNVSAQFTYNQFEEVTDNNFFIRNAHPYLIDDLKKYKAL